MTRPPALDRRTLLQATVAGGAFGIAGCTDLIGDSPETVDDVDLDGDFEITEVASGLRNPWGLAFVPDSSFLLVTERDGAVQLIDRDSGTTTELSGTPEVYAAGQGGMLDVTLHPAFPDEPWLYLTYSGSNDTGASATHLGRGQLDTDAGTLRNFEQLHVAEPFVDSDGHFGSRVLFDRDGLLYMTTGDRQSKAFGPEHHSQNTSNELGAILRLDEDGSIPASNPFVEDPTVVDSIFSYGHRNPQGLAIHPETCDLWESEHGEEDGDEINIIEAGENYGWPVASEACQYGTDTPVGPAHSEREDIVDPVYFWECGSGGFPPAGMTFYDGAAFPDWQGDLFVGNLAGEYLGHFAVENPATERPAVEELDSILDGNGWRFRDVAVAPDTGYLYVAIDAADAPIVRLQPE